MTLRLTKLKSLLINQHFDAVLLSSTPDIIYLTNFAHFSTHEREAYVLITKNHNYLFTDARYSHAANKLTHFTLLEIGDGKSFAQLLKDVIQNEGIQNLGIDGTDLTVHEFEKIEPLVKETKHFDLSPLRVIKEPQEIDCIKKACGLGDQTFEYILKNIREGMSEKEVAYKLENFIREHGAEPSFSTIIAFEENAAIPHHKTGDRKLNKGEIILLDFGVQYENYCSDMSRTICLGKASDEKKEIHQTVLEAQNKAVESLNSLLFTLTSKQSKPIEASIIDNTARSHIISQEYPSIPHSIGHGIGLEVHEAPSLSRTSKDQLKEGMVFSIEPGIYLNDDCGVRIEDLFTIENGLLVQLTNSPKELIEL